MEKIHQYHTSLIWLGNTGRGTRSYTAYERQFRLSCSGKPDLLGSSDPQFRGDASLWNPEELLLASIASCHMLWVLHLAADQKWVITDYIDQPTAQMKISSEGSGHFIKAILSPEIRFLSSPNSRELRALHDNAHKHCFIANSLNFPVEVISGPHGNQNAHSET